MLTFILFTFLIRKENVAEAREKEREREREK
jgi:phosphotransferase system  glucose/maltose/N-acetylglucosamine-specific IIC component